MSPALKGSVKTCCRCSHFCIPVFVLLNYFLGADHHPASWSPWSVQHRMGLPSPTSDFQPGSAFSPTPVWSLCSSLAFLTLKPSAVVWKWAWGWHPVASLSHSPGAEPHGDTETSQHLPGSNFFSIDQCTSHFLEETYDQTHGLGLVNIRAPLHVTGKKVCALTSISNSP